MYKKIKAFSIVEISIALTIIALLVAAVTAGSNIKRNLELQQIVDDVSNIKDAIIDFQSSRNYLPGDLLDAETQYGADNTNNGDGDNLLEDNGANLDERFLFWQHLALEGLISGTYDGSTDRMSGPLNNSLYWAETDFKGLGTHGDIYIRVSRGPDNGTATQFLGLFTTKEAYQFDSRYDDHDPTTGNIKAADGTDATAEDCVDVTSSPAEYNLDNTDENICVLYFKLNLIE